MKTRTLWMAALALLAILFISGTVFAEGEEPPAVPDEPAAAVEAPPPPTGEPESPAEAVTAAEEAPPPAEPEPEAPAVEPAAVEEAPVTEVTPAAEETAVTDPVPEPVEEVFTVEETLPASEELPVAAEAPVLVDAEGEPLVLATEEAAELLIAPDPYFTTGGGATTYSFTALDCDPDTGGNQPCANPLQAAIAYIDTNAMVPDNGFLYVEKATYTGNVVINYTTNPNLTSLTGLIGVQSAGLYPTISGSLSLLNLTNGFTLAGFNITGGTLIQNSVGQFEISTVTTALTMDDVDASGSVGDGIHIENHKGNIVMHHVTSNTNTDGGSGLIIYNQLSGSVTINQGSEFNNNGNFGARIITAGNVTLSNVMANDDYEGLRIESPGTVTLNSVMTNGNDFIGINIFYDSSIASIVNMNGVVANNNQLGVYVWSKGAILKNIVTSGNSATGLYVDILSGTTLLENVVANENGDFVGDGSKNEFGVRISAAPGALSAVTLRNVTASNNEDGGIYSETLGPVTATNINTSNTQNGDGLYLTTNGAVVINSIGAFENGGNGLYVRTKGAITITGIYASNNGLSGADLDNCLYNGTLCLGTGGIQVKNTSGWMSDLSNNQHFGLWAVSKGAITVTNLNAFNNGADGVYLTNRFGGSTAGITVNTLGAVRNNFSNNGANSEYDPTNDEDLTNDYYMSLRNGLSALSAGNISVTNTEAHQNQYGGAGIYLDTKYAAVARTVTLSYSNAGENDWAGVWIWSRGNITLTNVSANDNHSEAGIHVDNCRDYDPIADEEDGICSLLGNIMLTNIDTHNNNGTGLIALSKGTITLNGVNSSNNQDMGINLVNNFSGATAGVSLTNINANNNNNTGLSVITNGSALLTSTSTHNNAKLNGTIKIGETVQDFFNQNHGADMWWFEGIPGTTYNFLLQSDALWELNRADFDPWIELYDADDPETPLGVTITCEENNYCSFSFSPGDAPYSYTEATKFFVKVGSYANDGFYHLSLSDPVPDDSTEMFWVLGTSITAGGSITVRGIDSSSNSLVGLGATVTGNGGITLSDLGIFNNGAEGVYLTCGQLPDLIDSGFGTGSISITGINAINDNGWDGLMMATSGNVTISTLDASFNGQFTGSGGISIRNDTAAKVVTLSGINADGNGASGLFINATGNITLTNSHFWNNLNGAGVDMDNSFGTGTIRLTNVSSSNNQGIGIDLFSNGLITLSGVEASGNWGPGISLKNDYDGATAGITLSAVRAESNGDTGIIALTSGALLMSNVTANSNYLIWGEIDGGTTVQNYYSSNREPDHWWFEATEGVPIALKLWADGINDLDWLNRQDFDPFLRIFDAGDNEITSNQAITFEYSGTDWFSTDFYEIVWMPGSGESGWFYLEISSDNGNSGFYRLSVDDSDPTDAQARYVDGLAYHAGGSVALSGLNNFSDNEQAGLIGWNNGNVTLANFFAWGNGCEGIYLDNTGGSGNILINGTNGSGGNGWEGLRIMTDGAVTISNLEANNNGQDGIWITANTALKAVTLNNIVAMWNSITGLNLTTHGITTLNNVRSWFNGNDGAYVHTNGYNLTVLNGSFICNDHFGLAYANLPVVFFTNTNNIYLCNGTADLWVINP